MRDKFFVLLAIVIIQLCQIKPSANQNTFGAPQYDSYTSPLPSAVRNFPYSTANSEGKAGRTGNNGCPPKQPGLNSDGTITDPKINGGKPFYNCSYTFNGLEGTFFLRGETYFPCFSPQIVSVVKVGTSIPGGVRIIKGVHQSLAVQFPGGANTPQDGNNAAGVSSGAPPLTAALVTEGFIFLTNTTVPYDFERNAAFFQAKQDKIALRRNDSTPFHETQGELIRELYLTVASVVDKAQIHMGSFNTDRIVKMTPGPIILSNFQTFTTPVTRALEEVVDDDFIEAERTFGLGGSRFEFMNPKETTRMITKLVEEGEIRPVSGGDLGQTPQQSSRNTFESFSNLILLGRVTQSDFTTLMMDETQRIQVGSAFNFTYVAAKKSAYCDRPIEIDPRGHVTGGNMGNTMSVGFARSR